MLITRIALVSALVAGTTVSALAQAPAAPANPLVASSQILFMNSKNDVMKSVDKVSEDLWNWKPTPKVRSFGELFAHIADGQYEFCGAAVEGKPVDKGIEKTAKTKAEVVAALKAGFEYCEAGYKTMTDKTSAEMVTFGRPMTRLGVMDFNAAHNMEHYGNLVTYMRLKDIVPPTSKQ
jgi:uncharacterized damage-inducible protein DinB